MQDNNQGPEYFNIQQKTGQNQNPQFIEPDLNNNEEYLNNVFEQSMIHPQGSQQKQIDQHTKTTGKSQNQRFIEPNLNNNTENIYFLNESAIHPQVRQKDNDFFEQSGIDPQGRQKKATNKKPEKIGNNQNQQTNTNSILNFLQ